MTTVDILNEFCIGGKAVSGERYGEGHINDTNLVVTDKGEKYILQRVNDNVFPNISGLMSNIIKTTQYLKGVIDADGGDTTRECLNFITTRDGGNWYTDADGKRWRSYHFVDNAFTYQKAEDLNAFGDAGRAFGKFISRLDKYPAEELCEVIPKFHDTAARFSNFLGALETNYGGRKATCQKEIDFILSREKYAARVTSLLKSGELPLRVTHNDTKLNNVLFDESTKKAICVIDLDTIMPGSLLYDFGDAVRSGCSSALEDEKDLSTVHFLEENYDVFKAGFLSGIGDKITDKEREMLPFGGILMTYECGMRFLTDYLSGDTYFKTHYADHNLVRARTQLKLVAEMEKAFG